MRLVEVEHLFDGSKIIFYFTADERVDFRGLVRDLASRFHTRIEMRQIGVRNKARLVGGIGSCGRELCCCTFLTNFEPVSVKMAKDQNVSLNPAKISGVCGRLMCCFKYEYDTYVSMKRDMPKIGKTITTEKGTGKVVRQNVLANRVTIQIEDGSEVEVPLNDIGEDSP
jgi:cell fate regulator YaaT (PSP1 superfamily)